MHCNTNAWQPPIKELRDVYVLENDFRETLINFLKNRHHMLQVVTNRQHNFLTIIKVCQAILKTKHVCKSSISRNDGTLYINWNLLSPANVYIQNIIESNCNLKLLTINCTSIDFMIFNEESLSKVSEAVYKKGRKMILITEKYIHFNTFHKHCQHPGIEHIKDLGFTFDQLSEETQAHLLDKKLVIFQGNETKISLTSLLMNEDLLAKDKVTQQIKRIINLETLICLIKNEEVRIGNHIHNSHVLCRIYLKRIFKVLYRKNEEQPFIHTMYFAEEDLLKCKNKFIIIIGNVGMGKSSLFNNLTKNIKRNNPNVWLCRFNLGDYLKVFARESQNIKMDGEGFGYNFNKVIAFLIDSLLEASDDTQLKSAFERKFFRLGFDGYVRLVLFFDDFDEICRNYQDILLELLTCLQNTKVEKVYIASRSRSAKILENKIEGLFVEIQPYSQDDQISFLTKYWAIDLQNTMSFQMLDYISHRVVWLTDKSILENPLTIVMFAECFKTNVIDIHNLLVGDFGREEINSKINIIINDMLSKLNLSHLQTTFINRKLDHYHIQKRRDQNGSIRINYKLDYYIKVVKNAHLHMALLNVFGQQIATELTEEELWIIRYIKKEFPKVGLVHEKNGIHHFIHKSFAEHLAAEFIINNPHRGIQICDRVGSKCFFGNFSQFNMEKMECIVKAEFDV